MYQLLHLSDIPRQLRKNIHPNLVFISVAGPDNGGNFSLGTTVEAVQAAIEVVKVQNGLVIAERNARMPFLIGTTITADMIDYLVDTESPRQSLRICVPRRPSTWNCHNKLQN